MLDLSRLDLGEIANALADQTDHEHRWLINPVTGNIVFWTSETGIDGPTSVDLSATNALGGGWRGRSREGAPSATPEPVAARSSGWPTNSLIDDDTATRYLAEHPDPDVP